MPSPKQKYQAVQNHEGDFEHGDNLPLAQYSDQVGGEEDDPSLSREPLDEPDPKTRGAAPENGTEQNEPNRRRRRWHRVCCRCWCSKTCLIISGLFVAALITALGGGGLWVYKNAPKDGQSPAWYPTPRGGTVESWQQSYEKASRMVERMTLVEKVNITTGTGYARDRSKEKCDYADWLI